MKRFLKILFVFVAAALLIWYLSLYFFESKGPFEIIESNIPVNKCSLEGSPWILKSPVLLNSKNQKGVFVADELPEKPKTRIWHIDLGSRSCVLLPEGIDRNELEQVHLSEEKIFPISYPSFCSEKHVIQRTEYNGGVSANWCFRGLLLKRLIYGISFMGGGSSWGISQSYIGSFFLEVFHGKKNLFVIANSVYGATWGPTVTSDYLTYDPANKMIIFTDRYTAKGIIYWAHLDE